MPGSSSDRGQWHRGDDVDVLLGRAWGKTNMRRGMGTLTHWLPLEQHLEDAAGVAGWLWDHWLAGSTRALLTESAGGAEQAKALAVFLAGIHDVGKATPAFVIAVRELAQVMKDHGWPIDANIVPEDRSLLPHALAGHIILARYLGKQGWKSTEADALAGVVGGHHGVPPSALELEHARDRTRLMGQDPLWSRAQVRLIDRALRASGLDLAAAHQHLPGTAAQSVLSGIVFMADWIASSDYNFPLMLLDQVRPDGGDRLARGMDCVGLPERWLLERHAEASDEWFSRRFPGLPGGRLRPVQRAAIDVARSCDTASVMIIEAPMGGGKTEAALLAAEELAARSGAGGVGIFLPTQATSSAQFARVLPWLEALVADSADPASRRAISLLHGKAWLDPVFSRLAAGTVDRAPSPAIYDDDVRAPDTAYVHHWMTDRKKSPLSEVVVGTVDQLLFMALQSRHVALRHLALANKVIVIDEVHCYDAYMNCYLERALEWLGAYKVPVVMLSATLPTSRRVRLVAAYNGSLAQSRTPASWGDSSGKSAVVQNEAAPPDSAYPAITSSRGGVVMTTAVEAQLKGVSVQVQLVHDDDSAVVAMLKAQLAGGGCAAVIRNTVARAQATYRALVVEFGPESVTLAHARFIAADRVEMDGALVTRFGPGVEHRPTRHIVVATQVIEQSLDLDFDLLVSDIAPADLLLQRIGRLHRHDRERPRLLRQAVCYVTGVVDWQSGPPQIVKAVSFIYSEYDVLQTAALLIDVVRQARMINLPRNIPTWVQGAYSAEGVTPAAWEDHMREARFERDRATAAKETRAIAFRLASPSPRGSLVGWMNRSVGNVGDEVRARAQVRDSDDAFDVILAFRDPHGDICVPPWHTLGNGTGPVRVDAPTFAEARVIAACSTRVSEHQLKRAGGDIDLLIKEGEAITPASWRELRELAGQLLVVLDLHEDRAGASGVVGGAFLAYSRTEGLSIQSTPTHRGAPQVRG